jgi:hypothetical protein
MPWQKKELLYVEVSKLRHVEHERSSLVNSPFRRASGMQPSIPPLGCWSSNPVPGFDPRKAHAAEDMPVTLVPNAARTLGLTIAIGCLQALARIPFVYSLFRSTRLHRLITIAGLPDLKYSGIFTRSTYAPWNGNDKFRDVFSVVRSHTLVDEYRCYELWTLCGQLGELEQGDILEVGVWRGGTGCQSRWDCRLCILMRYVFRRGEGRRTRFRLYRGRARKHQRGCRT